MSFIHIYWIKYSEGKNNKIYSYNRLCILHLSALNHLLHTDESVGVNKYFRAKYKWNIVACNSNTADVLHRFNWLVELMFKGNCMR